MKVVACLIVEGDADHVVATTGRPGERQRHRAAHALVDPQPVGEAWPG
jgi:hypothetical protein